MTDTYPIDSGIIRCVCGFDDDDGFTIQCEKCNAWQHAQCVDIYSESEVPEVYYCDKCSDRKVDIDRAIQLQMKRKADDNLRAARKSRSVKSVKFREKLDKESHNGSNNSSNNAGGANNNHSNNGRRSEGSSASGSAPASGETTPILGPVSNSASSNNNNNGGGKSRKKRLTVPSKPSRDGSESDTDVETSEVAANNTGMDLKLQNKLLEKQIQEGYLFHLVKTSQNAFFVDEKPKVLQVLEQIPSLDLHPDLCSFVNKQEFAHIQPVHVHISCSNSALGAGNKFRFQGFSKFSVISDAAISRGRFIMEVVGHVTLQETYKSNPINQYRIFGMPKPGAFFIPGLDIAVDGRRIGSEASFLRLNCSKPNSKISTLVVANREIHFGLFSVSPVKVGEELSIPWMWDSKHPVQKILAIVNEADSANGGSGRSDPKLLRQIAEELSVDEKTAICRTVDAIDNRNIDCACDDPSTCILALLRHVRNQQATATAVEPVSPTATTTIYSAREQRKLQGALSLIDKLSAGDSNNKKKRKRNSQSPGIVAKDGKQNGDDMNLDNNDHDNEYDDEHEPSSNNKAIPPPAGPSSTEPAPLQIPEVSTLSQTIKAKFEEYRREYLANPPQSPPKEEEWEDLMSPIEPGISSQQPVYKRPPVQPLLSQQRPVSPKGAAGALPTLKEEAPLTMAKPPVLPSHSTGSIPSATATAAKGTSAPPTATTATSSGSTATLSSTPKLVKKLSFADYIKKKNK